MTYTLVDHNSIFDGLGARFRPIKTGPECELVDWFLREQPLQIPFGYRTTIFREPRLESGYPDLVLVMWDQTVARQWNVRKATLVNNDLRLLQFLQERGPTSTSVLKHFFPLSLNRKLERLVDAELIRMVKGNWSVRSLSKAFAVRRIVAIEAKMNNWEMALNQAILNTWFATDSFILVPRLPKNGSLFREAEAFGIRLIDKETKSFALTRGIAAKPPSSYASWLFNEWIWRVFQAERGSAP